MRVRFVTCLIVLAAASSAHADPSSCSHLFAGGKPPAVLSETQRGGTVLLCNNDYAVLASEDTKGPLWSAEDLTEEQIETARKTARKGTFSVDSRLPGSMQATLSDYRRSGYDRGHMTPSGDEPDAASQDQSFLLSNIVPQTAALNRGAWEGVESAVRGWADQEGEVFVVTGPGYNPDQIQKTVGPGKIPVPAITWKAIYDPAGSGTGAYICLNTAHPVCKITSVSTLTQLVNIDPFPALPASLKAQVASMPPIRQSPYALSHRAGNEKLQASWKSAVVQKAIKALLHSLTTNQ